ncbi:MAG: signal peptidase II [Gammaproteobacteria bacterium RIFCSPLOWO2_02_FULL_61_13]|nr:MAG: signal peptidase II [Gammaproteobacteria bacterium RIFCSPLOWO2_02_FULL_61_13]
MRWLWLSLFLVGVDQWTKSLATAHLDYGVPQALVPGLNLTLVHNTGAAFSLLRDAGGWQRIFFISLALTIGVVLIIWLRRIPPGQRWLPVTLALILGGAVGNLCDRILLGHVVDFLDVYVGHWHWPAFNIADASISVGAVMLVVDALWLEPRRSRGTLPS